MTNEGQWRALVASKQLEIDKLKLKIKMSFRKTFEYIYRKN